MFSKAWNTVQRNNKELRGSSNGVIGSYHKWLRVQTQGLDWLPKGKAARKEEAEAPEESEEVQALKAELERPRAVKEKFKSMTIKVRKEYDELRDVGHHQSLGMRNQEDPKGRTRSEQVPRSFMGQQQQA